MVSTNGLRMEDLALSTRVGRGIVAKTLQALILSVQYRRLLWGKLLDSLTLTKT